MDRYEKREKALLENEQKEMETRGIPKRIKVKTKVCIDDVGSEEILILDFQDLGTEDSVLYVKLGKLKMFSCDWKNNLEHKLIELGVIKHFCKGEKAFEPICKECSKKVQHRGEAE